MTREEEMHHSSIIFHLPFFKTMKTDFLCFYCFGKWKTNVL